MFSHPHDVCIHPHPHPSPQYTHAHAHVLTSWRPQWSLLKQASACDSVAPHPEAPTHCLRSSHTVATAPSLPGRWGLTSFLYPTSVLSHIDPQVTQHAAWAALGPRTPNGCLQNPRLHCQHTPSRPVPPHIGASETPGNIPHVHHSPRHGLSISFGRASLSRTRGRG